MLNNSRHNYSTNKENMYISFLCVRENCFIELKPITSDCHFSSYRILIIGKNSN